MQPVKFSINEEQYKEAIEKLGDSSKFYGFAKTAFLKALEEVKELKKEVWYECVVCHKDYRKIVRAVIEEKTGRLIPTCYCGRGLIKRVKKYA